MKRAKLLAVAISVIAQEGYSRMSMRKVALRAGCTTGTVNYYFANKAEMIKCVAQRLFDEIDTVLERQQANVDLSNVIEHWFAGITVQNAEGWLVWIQLLVHAQRESAFADLFRERYARFRKSFISTLLAGQEQGTIRSDVAADILADQISAFSDGWMAMTSLRKDGVSSDYHKTLVDALMTIIAPTQRTNPIQEAALAERHAPYDKS